LLLATTLALGGAAFSNPASAAAPEDEADVRALILPVTFEGDVAEPMRPTLDDAFAEQVQGEGYSVDRVAEDPGCSDDACYVALAKERGATHVVRATISGRDRDYEMKVELIDGESGAVIAKADGFCDTCGAEEVEEFVVDKAVRLKGTLRAQKVGPATLVVNSSPEGAAVYLDDQLVGTTPLELDTVAGDRLVKLSLDGYVAAEREISLVGGVEKRVELTLAPVPRIDSAETDSKTPKILKASGGAAIGVGLAMLGAGIALLVINDQPIDRKCTGDNVDADNDCKFLHDTLAGGIGLAAGGAVVAGVGVGLLVWGIKKGKRQPSATARLGVTRNGLMVSGRF
jgi:hypothetical protein